jgi:hypothetical protein
MPQLPRDEERSTGQPRIGTDEWVASVEGRRQRRSGVLGQLLERLGQLPFWAPLLVVAAFGLLFPFLTDSDYVVRVGFNALVFALLALGLNIVVGYAGLLDLGYIAFFGFGAYAYAVLSSTWRPSPRSWSSSSPPRCSGSCSAYPRAASRATISRS